MDKREYERRSVELHTAYEAAKRSQEQNPVPEQRSKALKEARSSYKRQQNALTAEYEATRSTDRTEEPSTSSIVSDSGGLASWLPFLIALAIAVGVKVYLKMVDRETSQEEVPAETLPQEEHRERSP
jgi:hypothetical protein